MTDPETGLVTTSGVSEFYTGRAMIQSYAEQAFSIGHTFVKGVDVSNGSLTLSRTDASVKRRGPPLEITRTYSSRNQSEGPFGPGWSFNYGGSLVESNTNVIDGALNGGNFVQISNNDGTAAAFAYDPVSREWLGQNGFHGNLKRLSGVPGDYDTDIYPGTSTAAAPDHYFVYTTKEGWQYTYADNTEPGPSCKTSAGPAAFQPYTSGRPNLVRVADPNGNYLKLVYLRKPPDGDADVRTHWVLDRIEHYSAGEGAQDGKIQFTWTQFVSALTQRKVWRITGAGVLDGSEGVIDLSYAYDDVQQPVPLSDRGTATYGAVNYPQQMASSMLKTVTRAGSPSRVENYTYKKIYENPDAYNPSGDESLNQQALNRLWRLSTVTDAEGKDTSYVYDPDACGLNGRPDSMLARLMGLDFVKEVHEPEGAVTKFAYGGLSFRFPRCRSDQTTVTNPVQADTVYSQNSWGGTFEIRGPPDPDGAVPVTRKTWSGVKNPDDVSATAPVHCGGSWPKDRLVCSETDALGRTTRFKYDPRGNLTERTDPDGLKESFTYNRPPPPPPPGQQPGPGTPCGSGEGPYWPVQKVCAQTDRAGRVTDFEYDLAGNLKKVRKDNPVVGPGGGSIVTLHDYFGNGDLEKTTDPLMHLTVYALYDASGQPGSVTDAEGHTTSFTYDGRGRLATSTDGAGNVTAYTYNDLDQVTAKTVAGTNAATGAGETFTVQTAWDLLGHKLCETEPDSSAAQDDGGTCTPSGSGTGPSAATGSGRYTKWAYDGLYRVKIVTRPLGWQTLYAYDAASRKTQETDPRGTVTRFGYDALDRLTSVIRGYGTPDTTTTRYTYDLAGNKKTETDGRGNTTSWEYDDLNRVTSVNYPDQGRTAYTYTETGQVLTETVKLTASESRVTTNGYDAFDRLLTSGVPTLGTVTVAYDKAGNVTSKSNRRGQAETRTYFDNNLLKSVTTAEGRHTEYQYDNANRLTATTLKKLDAVAGDFDRVTTQGYDALGRVTQTGLSGSSGAPAGTYGDPARTKTATWDGAGRVIASADFRGNVTEQTYDDLGRLTGRKLPPVTVLVPGAGPDDPPEAETGPLYQCYRYDLAGNLLQETDLGGTSGCYGDASGAELDIPGHVTAHTYDALSRRKSATDRAGKTSSWTYDANGNAVTFTDARHNLTRTAYDTMNRPTVVTGALGFAVSTTAYDAGGRVSSRMDGENRVTAYTYDALSRLKSELAPSGATTAYSVDADGNRTAANYGGGGGGRTQSWSYDSEGRVLTARSGNLPDTTYTYDAAGNLASFTDAAGSTTSMKFTLLNKPWRQQLADGSARAFEYDADGNLKAETDANGRVTQHDYDALSRRTATTLPAGAGDDVSTIDYAYDRNGNLRSTTEHASSVPNTDKTIAYGYDNLDRPVTKTDGDGNISTAVYDETGNRTDLTTANRTTHYDFDGLNRVHAVTHGGSQVASYSWNRASQPTGITRANGTGTVYGYDGAGRLTSLGHDLGNSRIAGFEYSYSDTDGMDLVSQLKEYRPAAANPEITAYTYDSAARLTAWQVTAPSPVPANCPAAGDYVETWKKTSLDLDSVGDRMSETVTAGGQRLRVPAWSNCPPKPPVNHISPDGELPVTTELTRTYSYNSRHQLTGLDDSNSGNLVYQWDNEGRLLSKGAPLAPNPRAFTWDSRDRLRAVEDPSAGSGQGAVVAEYRYEETGLKTESFWPALAAAQQTRRYQWVGREMLAVWKPGANPGDPYTVASRIVRGVDREILGHESNGNSFINVHSDRLGSVSAETDLTGNITHSRVYDPFGNTRSETGSSELPLGYTGQEMDPVTGLVQMKARWYDPDAGIFISEDPRSYSPADPFSVQEYLYANGDPVNNIDPSGMTTESAQQPLGALDMADMIRKGQGDQIHCSGGYCYSDSNGAVTGTAEDPESSKSGPAQTQTGTGTSQDNSTAVKPTGEAVKPAATAHRSQKSKSVEVNSKAAQAATPAQQVNGGGGRIGFGAQIARTIPGANAGNIHERRSASQISGERSIWDDPEVRDAAAETLNGVSMALGAGSVAFPALAPVAAAASVGSCAIHSTVGNCVTAALDVGGGAVIGKGAEWVGSVLKESRYAKAGAQAGLKYWEDMKAAVGAIAGKTRANAYSAAYETTIPKLGIGERAAHFRSANEALLAEMRANPEMANITKNLGIEVPTDATGKVLGRSPSNWTWHHVPDKPGAMQLVPTAQHQGSAWQQLLHPNQKGGFKIWGADY